MLVAIGRSTELPRSWRALLHYLHTGNISFRPLASSADEDEESASDQESTSDQYEYPVDAPSCSPKSMYRLAEKVAYLPLYVARVC